MIQDNPKLPSKRKTSPCIPLRDNVGKYTSPKKMNRYPRDAVGKFVKKTEDPDSDAIYDAETDNEELAARFQLNR